MTNNDKIYLDENKTKESAVNFYLQCRDGIVKLYEYKDESGYGCKTRVFYCKDYKHELCSIIRQVYSSTNKEWIEEEMEFDSYSFDIFKSIINGEEDILCVKYSLIRDY